MCHLSTEFCESQPSRFCEILLTNKLNNADENITSFAEVMNQGANKRTDVRTDERTNKQVNILSDL